MTCEAPAKACLQYFTSTSLEGLRKSTKISRQSSPSGESKESCAEVKSETSPLSTNLHDLVIRQSGRRHEGKLQIKEQRSEVQTISFWCVHTAGTANSECCIRLQTKCITKQYFLMCEWNRKFKHIYHRTKIKTSRLWKTNELTAFSQT
jgi:hypothetical protein